MWKLIAAGADGDAPSGPARRIARQSPRGQHPDNGHRNRLIAHVRGQHRSLPQQLRLQLGRQLLGTFGRQIVMGLDLQQQFIKPIGCAAGADGEIRTEFCEYGHTLRHALNGDVVSTQHQHLITAAQ